MNTGLTSVEIPGTVEEVGQGAFIFCAQLDKIELADGIDILYSDSFFDTKYYNDAKNWENDVLYIGSYAIKAKDTATSLKIKNGTKTITNNFATGFTELKSVTLPESLKTIDQYAFPSTGIEKITIPSGVTDIGYGAFSACDKLKEVVFEGSGALAIGWDAFTGVASDCKFYKTSDSKSFTGGGVPATITLKAPTDFKISVASATNGTVTPSATKAQKDKSVTFTATPKSGYSVKSVTVKGDDSGKEVTVTGKYSFKMPGEDVTITVEFEPVKEYTIALTAPTNGTASLSKTSAVAGTKITVTTKAADGYSTDKVTVTYSDGKEAYATRVNDTTYTFTLAEKNATVKVEFKKMGVVTITKPEHGSATATPTSAFEKTKITVKPVADSGYAVEKVTATDKSGKDVAVTQNSDGTYSFNMPDGDVTVKVTFKESYTVTIDKVKNGKVEAAVTNAAPKTKVILTVTPDNGYMVDSIIIKDKDNKAIATKEEGFRKYSFTMPSSNVTVTPKFKVSDWDNKFTDVKTSDWYYPYVEYVQKDKLMVGTSNTTFAPNTTTNRGMIVTILYRLEKEPSVAGLENFPDVPSGTWYTNAVAWAKDKKITYGDEFGHFGAKDYLTREQLAAMFYRYAEYKDKVTRATEKLEFTDSSKVSDWAEEAIKWCVENDIISGKGNNILDPQGKATRAEMATMISRFVEEID